MNQRKAPRNVGAFYALFWPKVLAILTLSAAAGAGSYPVPDVTNCGGVAAFMKIARLAEAFNLPVTSHGAHDITVHLLAACSNRSYLEAHGFGLVFLNLLFLLSIIVLPATNGLYGIYR